MRALDALAVLAIIVGCAGQPMRRNPHEGEHQLTFHNLAGGSVCGVFVFPYGEASEGANRLASNVELRNGDTLRMWLVPGDYQVRVTGCSYEKLDVHGYTTNVHIHVNINVVLFREDDATSKAAATRFAHDNENTHLMVAKVQLVKHPTSRTAPKEPDSEKPPL